MQKIILSKKEQFIFELISNYYPVISFAVNGTLVVVLFVCIGILGFVFIGILGEAFFVGLLVLAGLIAMLLIVSMTIVFYMSKFGTRTFLMEILVREREINKSKGQSVEELLGIIQKIQQYFCYIVWMKKLLKGVCYWEWFLYQKYKEKEYDAFGVVQLLIAFQDFSDSKIQEFLRYMLLLRSSLSTRLSEQQSRLIEAKESIQENLSGKSSDLSSVSEAQIARLDRQIEQFEELQKRLVRV